MSGMGKPRLSIREIFNARSVAIVGASDDPSKWGGRALAIQVRHRVSARVLPVNPRAATLMGMPAYASLRDCPGPVDVAMLLVPRDRTRQALEDCIAAGVGCAVIVTAGFAELGEEGRQTEQDLVALARANGVRLIGPNCIGFLNARRNVIASTAVALAAVDRIAAGGIGMASQSGALMGMMLARGIDTGAGFSSLVSLGNQCDIDINEVFEYLIEDPDTRVVCLYIEEVRDPARFRGLLARANAAGKPVLIAKSGRSRAGQRAVMSHTASLAGEWPVFEAVCRAHGVALFENIADLLDCAMIMERGQRMSGPRVAVFSGSGGAGALLVDALEVAGIETATLSQTTRTHVAPLLPQANREIPIDFGTIIAQASPDPVYGDEAGTLIGRVMEDDGVGAGVVMLTSQPAMDVVARAVSRVGATCSKPLVFVHAAGSTGHAAREVLRDAGYGFLESQNDVIRIMGVLRDAAGAVLSDPSHTPSSASRTPADTPSGFLNEVQARQLIEAYGLPTTQWRHARDVDAVVRARALFPGKVAIKAVSPTLVHKSDIGAVRLGIASDEDARQACAAIATAVSDAGHALDGFLVTAMVRPDAELILGVQRDPAFGPMVIIGAGGVLVELLRDVQMAPAPVTRAQALAMVSRLRCKPLLEGWRGAKAADLGQLADVIVRLGELAASDLALRELDVNPLMLVDGAVVAADARAFREPRGQ